MDPRRLGRDRKESRCPLLFADTQRQEAIGRRGGTLVSADGVRTSRHAVRIKHMGWIRRLRNLARGNALDRDIERELGFHIAEKVDELKAAGMSEEAARSAAARAFGNHSLLKERTREVNVLNWLESFGQDLRYATRRVG